MLNKCIKCGKLLCPDDVGATKKLINRGSTEFLCVSCLAEKFGVSKKRILEKIEYWRNSGCSLFSTDKPE